MMQLVNEDGYGAYIGVTDAFLQAFSLIESNPNFDVFDSADRKRRVILVKTSRIPLDDDLEHGRFGIDFNRGKPTLEEALEFHDNLAGLGTWTMSLAFSAASEDEYYWKAEVWDSLFSFIFDGNSGTVWLAPHSGGVSPRISEKFLIPQSAVDGGSAGVAALCAFQQKGASEKKNLITVHTTGFLEAVINLGDFSVSDEAALSSVTPFIESRYGEKIQYLAEPFYSSFIEPSMRALKEAHDRYGTLNPDLMPEEAGKDMIFLRYYLLGLAFYGLEISEYTLDEFATVFEMLRKKRVRAVSCNGIFPGQVSGQSLGLPEQVNSGLLDSGVQIECARIYIMNDPGLVSEMILDVTGKIFD